MDTFHRLIVFIIFFVSLPAHAGGWVEETGSNAASTPVWVIGGLTGAAACTAVKALGYPPSPWDTFVSVTEQYTNQTNCRFNSVSSGTYGVSLQQRWACGAAKSDIQAYNGPPYDKLPTTPCAATCPSGYIEQPQGSTTICIPQPSCSSGQQWDNEQGQCVSINPCLGYKGQQINGCISASSAWDFVNSTDGCYYKILSGNNQFFVDGKQQFCGTWVNIGEVSQDSGLAVVDVQATLPPPTCGSGKCLGDLNGQKICLPCENAGSGGSANTTVTTTDNGNGTSTTTTTTSNGTTTTTESSTTDSNGNTTQDGKTTEYNKDSRGSASSSCQQPPTCAGDPVQCAILNQEWQTTCAAKTSGLDGTDVNVQAGQSAINNPGLGAVQSDTINLGNSLDQTGFLTGSCLPDKPVSMGQFGTFDIPFSRLCWFFEALGVLIIGLAGLASAKIVGVF